MSLLINVCSKMLKMSDAIINVISAVTTTLSRIVFVCQIIDLLTLSIFANFITNISDLCCIKSDAVHRHNNRYVCGYCNIGSQKYNCSIRWKQWNWFDLLSFFLILIIYSCSLGRIYSVFGILENISKFIFVPIYATTYKHTVSTFPNAYFICSAVGYFMISVISM